MYNRALVAATASVGALSQLRFGQSIQAESKKPKLSIYDEKGPEVVVVPTEKDQLASSIGSAREWIVKRVDRVTRTTSSATDGLVNKWIGVEHQVESDIKEIAPRSGEPLLPGFLYVVVGGFTGSILARNRTAPIRWASVLAATALSSSYFLPETTENMKNTMWRYEQRMPQLAQLHLQAREKIDRFSALTESHLYMAKDRVSEQLNRTEHKAQKELDKSK